MDNSAGRNNKACWPLFVGLGKLAVLLPFLAILKSGDILLASLHIHREAGLGHDCGEECNDLNRFA